MNDSDWSSLKSYMYETAWNALEYDRNRIYYEVAFSIIQQMRNLKPNPCLADTARHLFATALGAVPGYVPAVNNDCFPLHEIQNIFIESYGLKKYFPTILSKAANLVDFKYFHNESDHHKVIVPSENIVKYDNRFASLPNCYHIAGADVVTDAKFMRGCVSISLCS